MKQRITSEQLNELTNKQKEQLREWWKPQQGDYVYVISEHKRTNRKTAVLTVVSDKKSPRPAMTGHNNPVHVYHLMFTNDSKGDIAESKNLIPLLSIGQMIELLETKYPTLHIDKDLKEGLMETDRYRVFQQSRGTSQSDNLCDTLWEALKTIL